MASDLSETQSIRTLADEYLQLLKKAAEDDALNPSFEIQDDLAHHRNSIFDLISDASGKSEGTGEAFDAIQQLFDESILLRQANPSHSVIAYELGAISIFLEMARKLLSSVLNSSLREIARDQNKMRVLRTVDAWGPISKGDLADRLKANPAQVTRWTEPLTRANLLVTVRAGKSRICSLTERARELLESITGGEIRGVGEVTQRPTKEEWRLADATKSNHFDHPDAGWKDQDRPSGFHLFFAGLFNARDLIQQKQWNVADSLFADTLHRYPLGTTFPEVDLKFFERLSESWPSRDSLRRDLMQILLSYQHEGDRQGLARDFSRIGAHLKEGSPLSLMWAPAAINVGLRFREHAQGSAIRIPNQILDRAYELLRSLVDNSASLHWQGVLYKLKGRTDKVEEAWSKIKQLDSPSADADKSLLGKFDVAISKWSKQLFASSVLNRQLESFESALTETVGRWVQNEFAEAKQFGRKPAGENWAMDVAEWSNVNHLKIMNVVRQKIETRKPEKLIYQAQAFAETARDVTSSLQDSVVYSRDLKQLIGRHLDQAEWILDPAKQTSYDQSMPRVAADYCDLLLNNFWSPEMVWLDSFRNAEPSSNAAD